MSGFGGMRGRSRMFVLFVGAFRCGGMDMSERILMAVRRAYCCAVTGVLSAAVCCACVPLPTGADFKPPLPISL